MNLLIATTAVSFLGANGPCRRAFIEDQSLVLVGSWMAESPHRQTVSLRILCALTPNQPRNLCAVWIQISLKSHEFHAGTIVAWAPLRR